MMMLLLLLLLLLFDGDYNWRGNNDDDRGDNDDDRDNDDDDDDDDDNDDETLQAHCYYNASRRRGFGQCLGRLSRFFRWTLYWPQPAGTTGNAYSAFELAFTEGQILPLHAPGRVTQMHIYLMTEEDDYSMV